MRKELGRFLAAVGGVAALGASAQAGAAESRTCESEPGGGAEAARRAGAFVQTLTPEQRSAAVKSYDRANATRWSNLPIALVPRIGVRLGDLTPAQTRAADRLLRSALSRCGVELLAEIRAADGVLKPLDTRKIGWDSANYFIAFIGEPSRNRPWILKVDGHHVAYNIAFNAAKVSATPLFDGVEPVEFTAGGRDHEPLVAQAGAMRALATAVAGLPGARLEGEFRDVTRGATQDPPGDSRFPITYPTGAAGRGVAYAALDARQKALARQALQAWVDLPNGAIARPLMADYTGAAALAETYVGFAGGADLTTPGSYVRIDGPRVWIEFIVQPAVSDPKKVHYHTIWRDKAADYGGAFAN
jgi:uncharacterized protein DUF3500